MKQNKFSPEEVEHSRRIFKSATPKYTSDWYLKWISSVFVLAAESLNFRSMRALERAVDEDSKKFSLDEILPVYEDIYQTLIQKK